MIENQLCWEGVAAGMVYVFWFNIDTLLVGKYSAWTCLSVCLLTVCLSGGKKNPNLNIQLPIFEKNVREAERQHGTLAFSLVSSM